jgi:hypothetical protein
MDLLFVFGILLLFAGVCGMLFLFGSIIFDLAADRKKEKKEKFEKEVRCIIDKYVDEIQF